MWALMVLGLRGDLVVVRRARLGSFCQLCWVRRAFAWLWWRRVLWRRCSDGRTRICVLCLAARAEGLARLGFVGCAAGSPPTLCDAARPLQQPRQRKDRLPDRRLRPPVRLLGGRAAARARAPWVATGDTSSWVERPRPRAPGRKMLYFPQRPTAPFSELRRYADWRQKEQTPRKTSAQGS